MRKLEEAFNDTPVGFERTKESIQQQRKRNLEQTAIRIENESSKGTIHQEELENE